MASRADASIDVAFFDRRTGEVTPAGSIATPWFGASALVLHDGRILISGGVVFPSDKAGCDAAVCEGTPTPAPSIPAAMTVGAKEVVRLFDPATGTTAEVGHLATARFQHQAVELDDGRVLILGGGDDGADPTNGGEVVSVEVFDLRTGSSAVIGTLPPADFPGLPRGTRLADGRILVLGGGVLEYPCGIPSAGPAGQPVGPPPTIAHELTYVFDPRSNRIAGGPLLPHFYAVDNAVPLAGGQALAFGYTNVPPPDCKPASRPATSPWLAVIDVDRGTVYESHDPFTGTTTLDVDVNRVYGAGVALPDGRVALIGDEPEQREGNAIDMVSVGK